MERRYSILGLERIKKLSEKCGLPVWWIRGLFVEYLDCRKFFEDGELWTFDFNMPTDEQVESVLQRKIILPGYSIIQNIRPDDLGRRTALGSVGSVIAPIRREVIFPEGTLNESAFPFYGNDLVVWDWKLTLHGSVVVNDDNQLYCWKIAELDGGTFKSSLFDTTGIETVYGELKELRTQEHFANPSDELKQKAGESYKKMEIEREKIRQILWAYHLKRKNETKDNPVIGTPPKLTEFDTIDIGDGKYVVHSVLEALLYRSAIRNYKLCKAVHDGGDKGTGQNILEIEYSMMVIVASVGCMESYVNMLIKENNPKRLRLQNLRKKWRLIAKDLNDGEELFDELQQPHSDFCKMVDWRNKVMHNKVEFLTPIGDQSPTSAIFSYENAKLSIETTMKMIQQLCKNTKIDEPRWMGKPGGSGGYWDETFHDTGLDFYEKK